MPVVKTSDLPTFDRLIQEGRPVLHPDRAIHQDIRELHIGFLNMMPDAALEATERQWFRLVGESNRVAQIHVHPFTLPLFERNTEAQNHIQKYYEPLEQVQKNGLDGLIVTGANANIDNLINGKESWAQLHEVLSWAYDNTTSTILSCFASHVLMTYQHKQPPKQHAQKRWGVYPHFVADRQHPLIRGINTKFDVCHSRFGEITAEQFKAAGMVPLIASKEIGVHMATSPDGFRQICLQGHPEYDTASLLKEYKREIARYKNGELTNYPPFPNQYFGPIAQGMFNDLREKITAGEDADIDEDIILPLLENTWGDSARSFFASWIGHVYQTTNMERTKHFMDGIDPKDPLGQRASA